MSVKIKKIPYIVFSKTTFWLAAIAIVIMAIAYIYFVNAIVWNVASRQQAEKKLGEVTAKIATLESEYMSRTSAIGISQAYAMGFKNTSVADTQFVKRSATLGAVTRQVQ
jgi:signal transduction histidine kinase